MSRVALLILLLAALSGCDAFRNEPLSEFSATFSGGASKTICGSSTDAHQFRYAGLGTSDLYQIQLNEAEQPGTGEAVTFQFSGVGVPSGTYGVNAVRAVGITFAVNGRNYYAREGRVSVAQEGGRLVGSFQVTDSFQITDADTSRVRVEGQFDVVADA